MGNLVLQSDMKNKLKKKKKKGSDGHGGLICDMGK